MSYHVSSRNATSRHVTTRHATSDGVSGVSSVFPGHRLETYLQKRQESNEKRLGSRWRPSVASDVSPYLARYILQ